MSGSARPPGRSTSSRTVAATRARRTSSAKRLALDLGARLEFLDDEWLATLGRVIADEMALRQQATMTPTA